MASIVLLLVATAISASVAQFLGGAQHALYNPTALTQRPHGQSPFQLPQLLTCIGRNEAFDEMRITLRPEPHSYGRSPAFQYGPGANRESKKMDWRISAVYIPAASQNIVSPAGTSSLVGSFFLGVTRYGRSSGSCAGLGGILQEEDILDDGPGGQGGFAGLFGNPYMRFRSGFPLGGGLGLAGLGKHIGSGLGFGGHFGGLGGGLGAFGGAFGHGQGFGGQAFPPGVVQDPMIISPGGTVYSGVIRNLAEVDLRGRGIAICLDAFCQRSTTTCCTVAKDATPATENVGLAPAGPLSGQLLQAGAQGFYQGDNGLLDNDNIALGLGAGGAGFNDFGL